MFGTLLGLIRSARQQQQPSQLVGQIQSPLAPVEQPTVGVDCCRIITPRLVNHAQGQPGGELIRLLVHPGFGKLEGLAQRRAIRRCRLPEQSLHVGQSPERAAGALDRQQAVFQLAEVAHPGQLRRQSGQLDPRLDGLRQTLVPLPQDAKRIGVLVLVDCLAQLALKPFGQLHYIVGHRGLARLRVAGHLGGRVCLQGRRYAGRTGRRFVAQLLQPRNGACASPARSQRR